jgi:hypothetical protein
MEDNKQEVSTQMITSYIKQHKKVTTPEYPLD